ncbi:MAG: phosphomethylpyrimidine synthase ThiC [Candidatus Omnitrophica bacterium]|nr:phosphomethylpyrimidine synthase ThiC [Candidatus Omnitrophota bacterium]
MTQLIKARNNKITPLMRKVSAGEGVSAEFIRRGISKGTIVLPANKNHTGLKNPCAIGTGVKTKINANIGTSKSCSRISAELEKLNTCVKYKADTVMDLSTGGDLPKIRKALIAASPIPLGTVPIYEIVVSAKKNNTPVEDISVEAMFEAIEKQAEEGVDFFTIHAGVTKSALEVLKKSKRLTGIVSRGGALMAKWIMANKKENPFYEHYDRLLDIMIKHDVTLSLGDGLRPGSIADATDKPQLKELYALGQLAKRARKAGCQVMIEGPGHVPINQIKKNVDIEKKVSDGAPFYVLGPLVTDIGCGYDHITAAIGGALAASFGADFLCYVTPSEHLGLPTSDEVKEGIIASRIAAHAADLAKGVAGAEKIDYSMSRFRRKRNWKKQISLALNPEKARAIHSRLKTNTHDACSMCDDFCPMKIL